MMCSTQHTWRCTFLLYTSSINTSACVDISQPFPLLLHICNWKWLCMWLFDPYNLCCVQLFFILTCWRTNAHSSSSWRWESNAMWNAVLFLHRRYDILGSVYGNNAIFSTCGTQYTSFALLNYGNCQMCAKDIWTHFVKSTAYRLGLRKLGIIPQINKALSRRVHYTYIYILCRSCYCIYSVRVLRQNIYI